MADTVATPEAQPLRVDVTMDEMEKGVAEADVAAKAAVQRAADEAKRKADADAAGEDPKVVALKEALRLSEDSRKRLETSLAVPPKVDEPLPEKRLTREELAELHQKDPLAAIEYMQAEAARTVELNLSKRLAPLVSGSASSLEDMMRTKYPEEFKLFGPEIADFVSKADRATFSVAKNWEDLIAWTRGKAGNVEKIIQARMDNERAKATVDAQAAQVASAGAHVRNETRAQTPAGTGRAFDDTEKAIIKELAASGVLDANDPEADYRRWQAVGR